MELLDAIETESLTKIKEIIKLKATFFDNDHSLIKYRALMKAFSYERKDVILFLLKHYCCVNVAMNTYSFTTTPFHCAIKLRDVSVIKEILKMKPSLIADSDGNTALHLALLHNHEEAIDLILEYIEHTSKYINPRNKYGLTHMHVACTRKNTKVIKGFLNAGISLEDFVSDESPSWAGYTALHFAVDFRSLEAFKAITDNDNVEHDVDTQDTADSLIQTVNKHLEDLLVISYFLENFLEDKDFDVEDANSGIYFHLACHQENPSLLNKFILNGANVDYAYDDSIFNYFQNTVLHTAVLLNNKNAVEQLLQHGAKIENTNGDSMTALHLALYQDNSYCNPKKQTILDLLYEPLKPNIEANVEDKNGLGYFEIAVTRNDVVMVKKFLDNGLDVNKLIKPNSKKFSHFTPLHFAIMYKHKEMAELLIERGANIDLTGDENIYGTPLHMAFDFGNKDLIELLMRNGANAKLVRSLDGSTMLHSVVSDSKKYRSHKSKQNLLFFDRQAVVTYVEQLVKLGVEVNARDEFGNTALHHLQLHDRKYSTCLHLLLELGADINLVNYKGFSFVKWRSIYYSSLCISEGYLIFYHHVQKLKTLGLKVHSGNEEMCKRIEQNLHQLEADKKAFMINELACRQQQRVDEVARLKKIMITPYTSLYNFLKLEPKRAATYVPNDVLDNILRDKDFEKIYPSYGYLIRLLYQRNTSYFHANVSDKKRTCSEVDKESSPQKRQRLK